MAVLKLPQDPRTAVFRQLVKTLRSDPVLSREVKTWLAWDRALTSVVGLTAAAPCSLRLTPTIGSQKWYTPDSNSGMLVVTVEAKILSWDADDHMNLWGAIERALYPTDRTRELEIEAAFVALGAVTGMFEFTQPLTTQGAGGEDNIWECTGQMQIEVQRIIRP